jgi:recombinational DNA repair protein RecT
MRTQITPKQLNFREKLETFFSREDYKSQLINLVGDEKQLNKHIAQTLFYIINKPELHKIPPEEVFKLILKSYELKIPINSQELCYIVPFKGSYQLLPTARGYKKRLLESSYVKNARAFVVYEEDYFKHWEQDGLMSYHYEANLESGCYGDIEKIRYAVAVINLKNGLNVYEVMAKKQLQTVQSKSTAPRSPAYQDFKEQMYKKIVLKRLLNAEPILDAELKEVNELEHQFYNFESKAKPSLSTGTEIVPEPTEPASPNKILHRGAEDNNTIEDGEDTAELPNGKVTVCVKIDFGDRETEDRVKANGLKWNLSRKAWCIETEDVSSLKNKLLAGGVTEEQITIN